MDRIKLTSCMAANGDFIVESVAAYISEQLQLAASFIGDLPWEERERQLDRGEIQVSWLCGLPYTWKADQPQPSITLLATPVLAVARYRQRPIYYSDIIVRADSACRSFDDLAGTTWAYNEIRSFSGHVVVSAFLARRGLDWRFFGQVLESGAHLRSLCMVLDGRADAAAIDSMALDLQLQQQPGLRHRVRILQTLGPNPAPPWVVSTRLPESRIARLRGLLLNLHHDEAGRNLLRSCELAHFAAVDDAYYDAIRVVARQAAAVPAQP